jgi:hypothetical protein
MCVPLLPLLMNLSNLGRKRWARLISTRLIFGTHKHNNSGNRNGKVKQETEEYVLFYLQGIAKVHDECYATRLVLMLTKFNLRYEEKGIIHLPSSLTKLSVYEKWFWSRGWRATSDARGAYKYEERNNEEVFWEDCETLEHCSWWKFCEVWKEKMPHLCIRSPCYGTCAECNSFKNAFCYREEKNKHDVGPVDEFSDDEEVDPEDEEENDWDRITQEQETSNIAESFLAGEFAEEEAC